MREAIFSLIGVLIGFGLNYWHERASRLRAFRSDIEIVLIELKHTTREEFDLNYQASRKQVLTQCARIRGDICGTKIARFDSALMYYYCLDENTDLEARREMTKVLFYRGSIEPSSPKSKNKKEKAMDALSDLISCAKWFDLNEY